MFMDATAAQLLPFNFLLAFKPLERAVQLMMG
jgi:hypothetical protein